MQVGRGHLDGSGIGSKSLQHGLPEGLILVDQETESSSWNLQGPLPLIHF